MLYDNFMRTKIKSYSKSNSVFEFEGYPCSFSGKVRRIRNYQIYGNTVDSESVGDLVTDTESEFYNKYKIPIKVSGKNLLSKWYSNMHYSGCTKSKAIYMEPGTYNYHFDRVDDTVTKWRYAMSIFDVDGGENDRLTSVYSYLATFTTNGWYCNDYGIVQTSADVTYSGAANVVFTILKPCYILWMLQLKNSSGTVLDAKQYAANVMLEKGDQYTGYEDYAEPMSKNIYLSSPLRSSETDYDYIDYQSQSVKRYDSDTEESVYLPPLSTVINGTNIITTGTTVEPSNIKIKYKE